MSADTNLECEKFIFHTIPSKKCRNPTKDSCTQKTHTCDPLSPYVGIIQIRFWVKASAYSQPACASTPFYFTVIEISNCIVYTHHFCDDVLFSTTISLYTRTKEMQALFSISLTVLFIRQIHISSTHLNQTEVLHPPSHLRHCLTILLQSFCPHKLRILLTLYLTVSFWFCPRLPHNTLMRHGT